MIDQKEFATAVPFPHIVVDNFFQEEFAKKLENEFPEYDDPCWYCYSNAIENKKTCNSWERFPENTYRAFFDLAMASGEFPKLVGRLLVPDFGLNGGGWHICANGGKLNPHLDYSLHPKLELQRKLNIIIYLSSEYRVEYGGQLGLYEKVEDEIVLRKTIDPIFNRAVIFDTVGGWHGLAKPFAAPHGVYRKSLAMYYLTPPQGYVEKRYKALFVPTEEQRGDAAIEELIKKRADKERSKEIYVT